MKFHILTVNKWCTITRLCNQQRGSLDGSLLPKPWRLNRKRQCLHCRRILKRLGWTADMSLGLGRWET